MSTRGMHIVTIDIDAMIKRCVCGAGASEPDIASVYGARARDDKEEP